jgi:predicted MPP superfamily phosphohydrolase
MSSAPRSSASSPGPGPARTPGALRRWVSAALATSLLAAIWGFAIEPRLVPLREDTTLTLFARPGSLPPDTALRLRLAHLADLHVDRFDHRLERLVEDVAAARPDLVLVSGDFLADRHDLPTVDRRSAEVARLVGALRRTAPVFAVEGHADHHGLLVRRLAEAGVVWLLNDGRRLGPVALLGSSQQAGWDHLVPEPAADFHWSREDGEPVVTYRHVGRRRNVWLAYDPLTSVAYEPAPPSEAATTASDPPRADADADAGNAPPAWSGVDLRCEVAVDDPRAAVGVAVHSREPLGEHRGLRLARARMRDGESGSFQLTFDGSWPDEGALDTGVAPTAGRWYALRLRTSTTPDAVRVEAKAWPADQPEPAAWQAWALDRGPTRAAAGTVALWGWGGGAVHWRRLTVSDLDGNPLPASWNTAASPGEQFRVVPRRSRLELARAKLEPGPPVAAEILLAHGPDGIFEAAAAGVELMFAGHTHGGQVRIPWFGALTTRSFLGAHYDRGRFAFAGAAPQGWSELFVSAGVGTSLLPVRFASPPAWGLVDLELLAPSALPSPTAATTSD